VGEGSVANLVIAKYNVQKIREALAKMVIVDDERLYEDLYI